MDDQLDDLLRDAARGYNEPPATPREEMWARIMAERANAESAEAAEPADGDQPRILPFRAFRTFRPFRHLAIAASIAALLAIGIGLGRLSAPAPQPAASPVVATTETPRVNSAAYRLAATEHLSQSEAFLTLFRASVRRPGNQQLASATARQLLATNRLLLDSPAASDARMRFLLQDLELVLAEIAQLSPAPRSQDLELITEGLEQGGVLSRLRTAVPAGTSATQGVL
jgi:hypothetical protein